MTLNPFIFIKFILYGKIDMKYGVSVSELTPPTKTENLAKSWTLTPKQRIT